ncbi:hypothetical protein ACVCAH_18680 [Micromonospora sp. LZ34]
MQPVGPYRFTHVLGGSTVGKAWAAIDEQGRFVTVAVLEGAAAGDARWREAFAAMADSLAQTSGGQPYAYADFAADTPWVAYPAEAGPGAEKLLRALGADYQPVPTEVESQRPVSGLPHPTPPQPTSGAPVMPWAIQVGPVSAQPVSAHPVSAQPVSAGPASGTPVSPVPRSASPTDAPVSEPPQTAYDSFTATGRRIAPVRSEPKRRGWIWIAAGALVLTLVAGTAGYALGMGADADEPASASSSSASLPAFEATQFSINKAKFEGELAPLAEPWLTRIGGCAADSEVGGPKLPADEERHVFCRYGGASLHFALYPAKAQKDAARAYRQQLNLAGGALAPGLREATRATGGVTGASGSYVEYAFKGEDGRTICGIWWDRDDVEGAFYVETLCEAGIAGNWDALRDLWRRNS